MFVLKNVKLTRLFSFFFFVKNNKKIFILHFCIAVDIYPPPKRVLVLGTSTKCASVEVLF